MGLLQHIVGGALTGFTLSDESRIRWPAARHGGMVLAINIGSVVPEEVFHSEVDRMAQDIHDCYQPMPGTDRPSRVR